MGLDCLRCHIKVPDPRYVEVADRLGMLPWLELPNWRRFSPAAAARARATLEGMLARDRNRPSVIAWTIVNEDRSHAEIYGSVVTELTDAYWEANGLLDIHRRPKAFHRGIASVNGVTTIIPRWERAAYWAGEEAKVSIRVSHGGPEPFPGGRLCWSAGDQDGEEAVPSMAPLSVAELAPVSIRLPLSAEGR